MAFGALKIAAGIGRGIGKFIAKRREKKEARIQKRIDSALASRSKLEGIFGSSPASGSQRKDAVSEAASAIFGGGDIEEKAEKSGSVAVAGAGMPKWLWPVAFVAIGVGVLFMFKKRGR